MREEIEKIENKIKDVSEIQDYLEKKKKELYSKYGYGAEQYTENQLWYKLEDLTYLKTVLEKLEQEKIDITKKYFITDNIYLSISLFADELNFYIYLEDDSWFYDNYIDSHSGLNEWIFNLINDEYALFSGNSQYCYAFGTHDLNDYQRIIKNKRENYYSNRKYKADDVVKAIKNLINYFTNEDNKVRNIIIDEINHKITNMKKLMEEWWLINKVILIGRLTASPELRYTTSNNAVTTFSIAVDRNFKNEDGNKEADFINIVAWNKKAELIHQYLKKGDRVGIGGRLQVRKYQNERGENRYVTEVVADEVEFLNSKKSGLDEKSPVKSEDNRTLEEKVNSNKPYEDFARDHQEEFAYTDEENYEYPF